MHIASRVRHRRPRSDRCYYIQLYETVDKGMPRTCAEHVERAGSVKIRTYRYNSRPFHTKLYVLLIRIDPPLLEPLLSNGTEIDHTKNSTALAATLAPIERQ